MNIYIANIKFEAKEPEIRQLFEEYGKVASAKLLTDRETGRSRGVAFIDMPELKEAQNAIEGLNNSDFMGRKLVVQQAKPRDTGR